MRLRHKDTNVQVLVPHDKATRLVTSGVYEPVPDDEQPPPGVGERKPTPTTKGATSVATALRSAGGPMWDTAL